MKNTKSKIKPIKTGATYCLGCKDCIHNFKPQEVKMANKVFREKSNCAVCRSNKSRFLKQKKTRLRCINLFKLLILILVIINAKLLREV